MRVPIKGKTLFQVTHLGQLVAVVLRGTHPIHDVEFVTDEQQPLQVGVHKKKAGYVYSPHIHLSNTKVVNEVQEILYVVSGKLRVTLFTIEGEIVDTIDLSTGDSIVLASLGHGVEVLEDAQIYEVKQGPYPGTEHAKIYFSKDQMKTAKK